MAECSLCGTEVKSIDESSICDECNNVYCGDHADDHSCYWEIESGGDQDETDATETSEQASDSVSESAEPDDQPEQREVEVMGTPRNESGSDSASGGRLIAGAILLVSGLLISITGIGAFIGVPLAAIGFGLVFPRFDFVTIVVAILSLIALVFILLV